MLGVLLGVLVVAIVALVATFRPIRVRIEHEHFLTSAPERKEPSTIEELDKENESIRLRARRFVKPFFERRARAKSIAAQEADRVK